MHNERATPRLTALEAAPLVPARIGVALDFKARLTANSWKRGLALARQVKSEMKEQSELLLRADNLEGADRCLDYLCAVQARTEDLRKRLQPNEQGED